jgi:hypothetical protein
MAFTAAQIDKAIAFLDYPVLQWSVTLFTTNMNAISSLSSDSETRVIAILTTLEAIETQLSTYRAASAGVQVKTDGTVYFRAAAIAELNSQYQYWRMKLSTALSISINCYAQSIVLRN